MPRAATIPMHCFSVLFVLIPLLAISFLSVAINREAQEGWHSHGLANTLLGVSITMDKPGNAFSKGPRAWSLGLSVNGRSLMGFKSKSPFVGVFFGFGVLCQTQKHEDQYGLCCNHSSDWCIAKKAHESNYMSSK
ncbi:hypothetical protein CC78DRAFT_306585 [Lojkania enalia]|uniref:Uncharacterized protein n=1 Tax=Lojkania enalia TaxID=147567 RepID=A0A9P4TN43_9PLEO|nr:hypothetical protein CC78DRAFT_306585 [Didymosphaeria enalia]